MAKQLLVFQGPVSSRSGYGDHARDLVRSMIKSDKYEVKIIDLRWGDCPRNGLGPNDGEILSKILTQQLDRQPDIFIQVSVPNEFQPMGKFNIGITAGIETTVCAPEWIEGLNRMNLIIVPSHHSKNVFMSTTWDKVNNQTKQKEGILKCTTPVEVLFEGADLNIFNKVETIHKSVNDQLSKVKEDFCFLHVGHWLNGEEGHSRKDTGGMIRTFCETFKNTGIRTRPALILKTSSATFSVIDREQTLAKIRNITETIPNAPNVYLVHGDLEPEELNSLYNHPKVKIHLSFTKGEGFGRPLLEASLSGKPVVATNWSGHVDFLRPHSILLPGELRQIHPSAAWEKVLLPESSWFYINYNYAAKQLKSVFKDYKKYIPNARKQRRHSIENFSIEKMDKDFIDILNKYGSQIPQQVELKLPTLNKVK